MSQQPGYTEPVDEATLLARAQEEMKVNIYLTKRHFDQNNIPAALTSASQVIQHLRTSSLGPNAYYELWMKVTDALRDAEYNFDELDALNRKGEGGYNVTDLYQEVQHCGNIIPRLYLLITVASTYIKSKRAPCKIVLSDLIDLCRGVQHPVRGLFLRFYLSQMARDKLPDVGSEYEGTGGNVNDAIEFVLQNFTEMTKLWVRMQHQGSQRDRQKREKERRNLRQLVGNNLVRLSNLQGLTLQLYRDEVLPRLLDQVINSKDVIAQEYLMDCIIQVFPDDFHLETLEAFLQACAQLHEKVNVKDILVSIMSRLSTYAQSLTTSTASNTAAVMEQLKTIYPLFLDYGTKIVEGQPNMPLVDVLSLQVAHMNFSVNVYPERLDYPDKVLEFCASVLMSANGNVDAASTNHVIDLLTAPLAALKLSFLQLTKYKAVLHYLNRADKKRVARSIGETLLSATPKIVLNDVDTVKALFQLLLPLIKDETAGTPESSDAEVDRYELEQEQVLLVRIFHLIDSTSIDVQYKIYEDVRRYFGQGGTARIEYTLPPLVYGAMRLAERAHEREKAETQQAEQPEGNVDGQIKARKIFKFIHETLLVLVEPYPELALRLFMQAAYVADKGCYEVIAYEFAAQAFIAFETEVADSRAQFSAINYIIASLLTFKNFNAENYENLASKATQHSARLLPKADQCRSVYNCAHLFWSTDPDRVGRDEKRVLQCLQRALKIANASMGNHTHLFVEVLNKYMYFYDKGCPSIEVKHIKALTALIEENMGSGEGAHAQMAVAHYQNTLAVLEMKRLEDNSTSAVEK